MGNILTITRRDLKSYFTSPIGYIFIIVFLMIGVGLYMSAFFNFPVADMRNFFGNLPMLLCVFIPAVTMRVWAEERKENTWEMLLTFPMRARELVIGKFLACLTFFIVTLAATSTVPLMLASLGNPDNGAIWSGYLGTLLLGGLFLSIGIFFSGFCKDQIVAFVVALLVCFALFLLGTDFIAAQIDAFFPEESTLAGLGTTLSDLLGVLGHYNAFTRGVIEAADVLYFLGWTVLFLWLNILYIDGRNRPGARSMFATAVAVCMAIGLLFNWLIGGQSLGRLDLTEDKIYTISEASEGILRNLSAPVHVNLYISKRSKMPTQLADLERDITAKLEELSVASSGNFKFKVFHMDASSAIASMKAPGEESEEEEENPIEKRMLDKGITPLSVSVQTEDGVENRLVYSSIGIAYKDNKEEVIPQVMPQTLTDLEYQLMNKIYRMTIEKAPVVAMVAPKEAVNIDPQMRQILMQMGQPVPESEDPYEYLQRILESEKYTVERVELSKESGLPEEFDTLVVVNPRSLNDRQRWEINRAVVEGKSVVLAVQNYEWDYRSTRDGLQVNKRDEDPQVNPLLEQYGVGISRDVLMDINHVPLTIQTGSIQDMFGGGQQVDMPTQMLILNDNMDKETAITSRLDSIFYLWGSKIDMDDEKLGQHGLEAKVLMSTSDKAWTTPEISQASIDPPIKGERYPVLAMVSGQFPDAYKDAPRPTWPTPQQQPGRPPMPQDDAPEAEATPIVPAAGKMVLFGASQPFRKNFLQAANLDLFLNCVDAVTLSDALVEVRGRKPLNRIIDKPTKATARKWRFVNFGLVNIVIAGSGIGVWALRRRSRNAYTMSHLDA